MKRLFVTVAILGLLITPTASSTRTAASRPNPVGLLAPTPAPVAAGGGIAAAMGLVGAPIDLVFALRGGKTTDFWQYSISQNTWTPLPNTPAPVGDGSGIVEIFNHNSCAPGANRFSLAALRGDNSTDFWIFDINANTWCTRPGTPAPVGPGGAIAQLQRIGKIYALRGGATTTFWSFDSNGVWQHLADTPGPVNAGGGLVGINYGTHSQRDVLYALQGGGSTAIWKYDVATDKWTHQADTPAPVGSGGGITSPNSGKEGTLVVLQGGGSTAVWSLDIHENIWRTLNAPSDSVAAGGAISHQFNGCNFVLTGGGSGQFFSTGVRDCEAATPQSDFSMSFHQPTVNVTPGTKVKAQLNISRANGSTGIVTLLPPAAKWPGIIVPQELPLADGDSVSFKIKVKGGAQPGTYQLSFMGRDNSGKNALATLTIIVQ
jgi:hypothetical protein